MRRKPNEPDMVLWTSCSKRVTNTTRAFIFLVFISNMCICIVKVISFKVSSILLWSHMPQFTSWIAEMSSSCMQNLVPWYLFVSWKSAPAVRYLFCFWTFQNIYSSYSSSLFTFYSTQIVTVINELCNAPTAASVTDFLTGHPVSYHMCYELFWSVCSWSFVNVLVHSSVFVFLIYILKPKNCTILGYLHMYLQSLKHFLLIVLDVHGHNI